MKKIFLAAILLSAALFHNSCQKTEAIVCSPDNEISFLITLKNGSPVYSVTKDGTAVLKESA